MSLTRKLTIPAIALGASLAIGKGAYAQNPAVKRDSVNSYQTDSVPPYLQTPKQRFPIDGLWTMPGQPYYPAGMINQICTQISEYQRQQASQPQAQRPQTQGATRAPAHPPRKTLHHVPQRPARPRVRVPTRQVPYINTDSIARESRRKAQERVRLEDSVRAAEAARRTKEVADSTARVRAAEAARQPEFVPPREKPKAEFGLEALYGTNRELSLGAFANTPIFRGLRLEGYADYSVLRENPYDTFSSDTTNDVTQRINDFGLYKRKIDRINTSRYQKGIAEVGGRIVVEPFNWLDFIAGAGARIVTRTEDKSGEAVISFETNGVPRDPPSHNITGSTSERATNGLLSVSGGLRAKIGKINLNAFYDRIGKRNIWRFGIGGRF